MKCHPARPDPQGPSVLSVATPSAQADSIKQTQQTHADMIYMAMTTNI
jgi:hypothetical protein